MSYKTGSEFSKVSLFEDLKHALELKKLIYITAGLELKRKYRRTALGPLWGVLSNLLFAAVISIVFHETFGFELADYFVYAYTGYVVWVFLSDSVGQGGDAFMREAGYILNERMPLTFHILKHLLARIFTLALNLPILFAVIFLSGHIDIKIIPLILGVFLLLINSFLYSVWGSFVSLRWRDYTQLVANIMRFVFFLTPIIWLHKEDEASFRSLLVDLNPFSHFLSVVRGNIISGEVALSSWVVVLFVTLVNFLVAVYVFRKYRTKVVYWCL